MARQRQPPVIGMSISCNGFPEVRASYSGANLEILQTMSAREKKTVHRCRWSVGDPLMQAYHDEEWGVPERDGRRLWEKLMLDGFQAGLSWSIILRKRDAFRKAFKGFDPPAVARFKDSDVVRLLDDAGIVRSRAKIEATIGGARAYLQMQAAGEDFAGFIWG